MEYAVVIVAAGSGTRMNLGYNKVFYELSEGVRVIDRSIQLFHNDDSCKEIILVLSENDLQETFDTCKGKLVRARGGKTRAESVYNGLLAVGSEYVLIHDGARPFVTKECIDRLLDGLKDHPACILATPEKDTLKVVEDGVIRQTLNRSLVWHAQTPQAFKTDLIIRCVKEALDNNVAITDDAQAVELFSQQEVHIVMGDERNIKLTVPADLEK